MAWSIPHSHAACSLYLATHAMAQPPCPALRVGSRRPYKANKGRASALGLAIRVAETGNQAAPLQTCQRQKPPAPPCAPGPSRHTHRPTLLSGASPARLWPASCPPRDARARAAPPPPAPALLSLPALTPPPPPLSISATPSERRRKKGAVGGGLQPLRRRVALQPPWRVKLRRCRAACAWNATRIRLRVSGRRHARRKDRPRKDRRRGLVGGAPQQRGGARS